MTPWPCSRPPVTVASAVKIVFAILGSLKSKGLVCLLSVSAPRAVGASKARAAL